MITATAPNLWAVAGLVYALAGAGLICSAVFSYAAPFTAAAGNDVRSKKSQFAQQLDGRLGALLLFLGFFFQASGLVGGSGLNTPGALVLLGLALGLLGYVLAKDLIIEQAFAAAATPKTAPEPTGLEPARAEPVILVAEATPAPVKTERLRVVGAADEA